MPYNREIAKLLAECSQQTYEQYLRGQKDHLYDGAIDPPAGYTQIASFKKRELNISGKLKSSLFLDILPEAYFGFALTSQSGNIIALRGTSTVQEWLDDFNGFQVNYDLWDDKRGKVHAGFYAIYEFLRGNIRQAASQFNKSVPCYITGHSLGSALAVLTAIDLAVNDSGLKDQLQLYTYAGPRVGDPDFAEVYNQMIPHSYRVVNLADVVPITPPRNILKYSYKHVGEEWSYVNQTGDISDNHSLKDNYIPAMEQGIETSSSIT